MRQVPPGDPAGATGGLVRKNRIAYTRTGGSGEANGLMAAKQKKPRDRGDEAKLEGVYRALVDGGRIGWESERPFLKVLGVGGQGVVFLSERRGVNGFSMPVALKVFSPEPYRERRTYEREMERVARVASRVAGIQQDHLVDVQNVIMHDGVYVLEMEWVDGYDLRRLLTPDAFQQVRGRVTAHRWESINRVIVTQGREQPRLRPGTAVSIIRECLTALAALHRQGIIHNDIKPGNVMLKRSGNAKIIDIGSAYELKHRPASRSCTPNYAAPEVLTGQPGTARSDLASLGYMLTEMICGVQPFEKMTFDELVHAKNTVGDWLPKLLPPEEFAYSEPLLRLIRGLMHPDPRLRFRSAEDAELGDDGAAVFQRELVKGDLASEYATEIRRWIDEVEAEFELSDPSVVGNTALMPSTRMVDDSGERQPK